MEEMPSYFPNKKEDTDFKPVSFKPEEEILASLHQETGLHSHASEKPDNATLERLHGDVAQSECFPLFEQYMRGEIPAIERLFANLQPYLDELTEVAADERRHDGKDSKGAKLIESLRNTLAGRERQIKYAVNRYVDSVIRFHNLKRLSINGLRDLKTQFEQADHARRRAHNALIDSLSMYQQAVQNCEIEGLGRNDSKNFNFEEWTAGTDAKKIGPEKTVIFSPATLRNRDFIRDWAIVADFTEQLKTLGDTEWLDMIKDHSGNKSGPSKLSH